MNAAKVVKLDVLTVRPYFTLKNLLIFLGLGFFYALICKNGFMMLVVAEICALLYSGYPFMVGENSGIDPLYRLFGISAKDVVKGRYAVAILFTGTMLVIGTALYWLTALIYPLENLDHSLLLIGLPMFFIVSLIVFLEYPFYFKLGYFKGKNLASIPYYIICVVVLFGTDYLQEITAFLSAHAYWIVLSLLGLWLAVLFFSYRLSLRFYLRRDF